MKRLIVTGALVSLLGAALVAPAAAADAGVSVTDNRFSPESLRVAVGDAVTWTSGGTRAGHNVREDHRIFYSGTQTDRLDFSVVFSAGSFHYFCENHGTRTKGMGGWVRVPATVSTAPAGDPFTVRWATTTTETGPRYKVQYRIASGRWIEWKASTRELSAVFGRDATPIPAVPGTQYGFRVRAIRGENMSFWSPVATFTP